jgi:hypothetical protein
MANEMVRENGVQITLGERTFYSAGDNVYVTDVDHETGVMLVAVQTAGTPWKSNVLDKNDKPIRVERGKGNIVDKLPSLVFASTKGAVKLNASGQCLSLNLYIPADYGKQAKEAHNTIRLEEAFKPRAVNPLHVK